MKKTLTFTLLILLAVVFVLTACSSTGFTVEYGDELKVNDGANVLTFLVTTKKDASKNVVGDKYLTLKEADIKEESGLLTVPKTVVEDGITYEVKAIGEGAFVWKGDKDKYVENTSLKAIVLPEGLTEIGNRAFYLCSELKTITFPESLEAIGGFAFFGCRKIEEINLHNIKDIGAYSFRECTSLKKVVITASERPNMGEHVFFYIDSNAAKDNQFKVLEGLKIYVPDAEAYKQAVTSDNPNYASLRYWNRYYADILVEE